MPKPYYESDGVALYHGDSRDVIFELAADDGIWHAFGWGAGECIILDPPWDLPELLPFVAETMGEFESLLCFTDARRFADPIGVFGAPQWVFTWNTMNTWSRSPRQPVQQTKHCLWYGQHYDRDAELWGDAPPVRDHPTTKQQPLDGRRLTDLWSESLRWLHNGSAGSSAKGSERFGERRDSPMKHAKPVGWMRCLIGNTSCGPVIDPFMGSGSAVLAAKQLGRLTIGIDIDERCCEFVANRLERGDVVELSPAQEVLPL